MQSLKEIHVLADLELPFQKNPSTSLKLSEYGQMRTLLWVIGNYFYKRITPLLISIRKIKKNNHDIFVYFPNSKRCYKNKLIQSVATENKT